MDQPTLVDVLLVEDNPHDAELITMALKEHSLAGNMVWLKDGKEAVDFLFDDGTHAGGEAVHIPRVMFLDLKLPKINGLEVLRKIKSDSRTLSIPVIVLTSSGESSDKKKSYELGVNSYIVKPIDPEKFIMRIKEIGAYWILQNRGPK